METFEVTIRELASALQGLSRRAVNEYTPIIDSILYTKSTDVDTSSVRWTVCSGSVLILTRCCFTRSSAATTTILIRRRLFSMSMHFVKCGIANRKRNGEQGIENSTNPADYLKNFANVILNWLRF